VTAWACEYKCGRSVTVSRKNIERHEQTCKMNPARRACPTCKYEDREWLDYNRAEFFCQIDALPDGMSMVVQCEKWEPQCRPTLTAAALKGVA